MKNNLENRLHESARVGRGEDSHGVLNMRKKQLSQPKQQVIQRCQEINFGTLAFKVVRGEPGANVEWRAKTTIKLAGLETGPRPEAELDDFDLRQEQIALVRVLESIQDASVTIEVRHGLPFLIEIEQDHQAA